MKKSLAIALLLSLGLFACKTTQTTTTTATKEVIKQPAIEKPAEKPTVVAGTDTPGSLQFFAKNDRYSAEGGFKKWHFTNINIPNRRGKDATGMTASILIETASVTEKAEGLQKHLQQEDFLGIEKFPEATVNIKDVAKVEGNNYKGTAVVKIKTFEASYPVTFELSVAEQWHVKGEVIIMRKTFELGVGNENVENEVKVTFDTDLK